MNERLFTGRSLVASDPKDSTPRYGRRLLCCGTSMELMSQLGHPRRIDTSPAVAACPLLIKGEFQVPAKTVAKHRQKFLEKYTTP
jgi:hypothetical protein